VEVPHDAGQRRNQGGDAAPEDGSLGRIKLTYRSSRDVLV
jgi:hypothetical protein